MIKEGLSDVDFADILSAVFLADYSFNKYKSKKDSDSSVNLSLQVVVSPDNLVKVNELIPQVEELVNSVNIAKDLVNEQG